MIWLYRMLFLPILCLMGPYYLMRMLKRGGYRRDFRHRMGFFPKLPDKQPGVPRVWIQAVSVGELLAVVPLISMLRRDLKAEIVLTTTTSTGYALLRQRLQEDLLAGGLFPVDFLPCSQRAWQRIQPDCILLMEGELWPEHLHQAKRRKIPALLINARLSDRSYRRFRRLPGLSRKLLHHLAGILASSEQDARRFRALSGNQPPIRYTGNLKFDADIQPAMDPAQRLGLLEEIGFVNNGTLGNREKAACPPLILLGSSTWPGEETLLLRCLNKARAAGMDCRLILVPRHAERGAEIQALLAESGLGWKRRSNGITGGGRPPCVYLADTTGELVRFTQIADLAFIGKSLPPNEGGQSPVEAAAMGIPSVMGPAMSNFREISHSLTDSAAARLCMDAQAVEDAIRHLLQSPGERSKMTQAARVWHSQNRGAAREILAEVKTCLVNNTQSGGAGSETGPWGGGRTG